MVGNDSEDMKVTQYHAEAATSFVAKELKPLKQYLYAPLNSILMLHYLRYFLLSNAVFQGF